MPSSDHKKITQMEWDELEEHIQTETRGKKRSLTKENALIEYFGQKEFESLQKLANHSRAMRSRAPVTGNVVFLHGIMGSNLITKEKDGDEDLIWVSILSLAQGRIERLRLSPDGKKEADADYVVEPTDLDKRTYARAILWLRARWNVQPFAYDWRKDIDVASDALADFIKRKFGDAPVNLVAHSMGGLVSRNFIRRHKDMWEKMRGGNNGGGSRLIMLGTPNYGSFVIPQTFTGTEKMVKVLAFADLKHSMQSILKTLNSFVGCYLMLPAPSKIPASSQAIYREESWGGFPISSQHLKRAVDFHSALDIQETKDPERMVYIAGCNRETLAGIKISGPGEFDYTITYDGDGRVPHALGLLENVPTYYVEETHGDLTKNEKVLAAVDELLECGRTTVLSARPLVSRGVSAGELQWRRPAGEQQLERELRDIASMADEHTATAEAVRYAEETIVRAVTGGKHHSAKQAPGEEVKRKAARKKSVPLHIEIIKGDVTQIQTPVIVIGHYKGVAPVSAEGAVDKALNYWISRAGQQGIIGADLGELFFIPVSGGKITAKAVLLAGMGEPGKFRRDDLRYLMTNVTYAVSALGVDTFTSVLIGSGEGNISRKHALCSMIDGISDAFIRLPQDIKENRIKKLGIIEYDKANYDDIVHILKGLTSEKGKSGAHEELPRELDIKVTSKKLNKAAKAVYNARPDDLTADVLPGPLSVNVLPGTKITVERNKDTFRFSALSQAAVIPVREVKVQSFFAGGAAEKLMQSATTEEQEQYGQLLSTYLIPEDFRQTAADSDELTLVLDRSTAAFPWEMACLKSSRKCIFFGPDLKMTRQFRTLLSSSPGIMPQLNKALKVLVIADPAPESELQLPGARREGREVVRILNEAKEKKDHDLDLTIVERIGSVECDPVEILALILNEEFDIIHFAGHGVFDEKDPDHSGWVFGRDLTLSAREIFCARRVPRLVFANACFSAVIKDRPAMKADEMNRGLAGIAEAFFERGIQNYIGTGWPVDDEPAVEFAGEFYRAILAGNLLGDALAGARSKIMGSGSTWGAYQHYGQVNARLVIPS